MEKFPESPHIQRAFERRENGWQNTSLDIEDTQSDLEKGIRKSFSQKGLRLGSDHVEGADDVEDSGTSFVDSPDDDIDLELIEIGEENVGLPKKPTLAFAKDMLNFCDTARGRLMGLTTKNPRMFLTAKEHIGKAAFGFERHWNRLNEHADEGDNLTETSKRLLLPVVIETRKKFGGDRMDRTNKHLDAVDEKVMDLGSRVSNGGADYLVGVGGLRNNVVQMIRDVIDELTVGKTMYEREFGSSKMNAEEEIAKEFPDAKRLNADLEEGIHELAIKWMAELQEMKEKGISAEKCNQKLLQILDLTLNHQAEALSDKFDNISMFNGNRYDDLMKIFVALDLITRLTRRSVNSTVIRNRDLPKKGEQHIFHENSGLIEAVNV